jgi:hypothetical protein
MAYIGSQPTVGLVVKLNDIASSFNSILKTFQLSIPPGGVGNNFTPGSVYQIIVSLNGVIQNPNIDYILNGSQITFTTAPAAGLTCFIIALGQSINVGTPSNGTVTTPSFGTLTSIPLTGATSGTTTIQPPAVAGNNTLTLPTSNGSANQFLKNGATAGALAFGTTREDASGNLAFNSGYGSSAVAYGCRAWINFDGTGARTIRGSGNVSSIMDNGTGDYTVNFATAMPDANFSAVASCGQANTDPQRYAGFYVTFTTSSCRIYTAYPPNSIANDVQLVCVAVFR